ncbi:MAG: YbhB/YbcL family Raf kinase inhibitor-like protein [Gemmatimonadota bacterium]
MRIISSAFAEGDRIPEEFTGEGADRSPPLEIADAPDGTRSFALIVDDPDAPTRTWVHWLIWGIPAELTEIPEGVPRDEIVESLGGARQGRNDFDDIGYGGPMPPPGHGTHHYRFTVYALDETIDLDAGAKREALESAMEGRTLATARLTGTYERD